MAERTLGWVQDPGSFDRLRRVVAVFDPASAVHAEVVGERIPRLVEDAGTRERLLAALAVRPLRLTAGDLSGRALGGARADDPCNGIVQATLDGQRRAFLSDWAADNFVRWAHALGFLHYDRADDTFSLTPSGACFVDASDTEVRPVLTTALLSYPPAVRVLRLLADGGHLTKFEIGAHLGFVGEGGFTSLNQDLLVREINLEPDVTVRRQMLNDWDGTSDKYARTIAGWLEKMGLVRQVPKTVGAGSSGLFGWEIAQAYTITSDGVAALRKADGSSRHGRIPRNVPYEMLATKAPSRDYLRARRAALIRLLETKARPPHYLREALRQAGFDDDESTVLADIDGLVNMGLRIERDPRGAYALRDAVQGLDPPAFHVGETRPDDVARLKEDVRRRLHHVPHEYLSLIDMSFDGSQNRVFEFQVMALLQLCGYEGRHLGGSDRPDGAFYTTGLKRNYGLIVDAKAYSDGFRCDRTTRDQMKRYIDENVDRPASLKTPWWQAFPDTLRAPDDFRFLFVSSRFTGQLQSQLERLASGRAGTRGAAISASDLLLFAEAVLAGRLELSDGWSLFGTLDVVAGIPVGAEVRETAGAYQGVLDLAW